jgi:membrane associated rhomboid family serine protease
MIPIRDHNPSNRTPFVTYALIAANVGAFFMYAQYMSDARTFLMFLEEWALIPARLAEGEGYETVLSSMFIHAGLLHLGGNMLFLWIFGNNIEDLLGRVRFLALYLGSGVAAALAQGLIAPESPIPMIGASGAVAGVLGAYLLTYPHANVHVFVWIVILFWVVTVPAWLLLGMWFAMQLFSGLATAPGEPGVAFWAHVGGFVAGVVLFLVLRPRGVALLQPQKTPVWAHVPPRAMIGRRTFHRGSVPDTGPPLRRPRGPWDR